MERGRDRAETEREVRAERKRLKTKLRTKLENQIEEWNQLEPEDEEMTENAKGVLNKVGKATTDLIRKVIRDGMETERMDMTEEIYKYNEYKILDVSWSQFSESKTD
jgi:glutamyl-tRNA reductase